MGFMDPEHSIASKGVREDYHLTTSEREWLIERLEDKYSNDLFDMDDEQLMFEGSEMGVI